MMEKIAERGGNLGATTQGLLQLLDRVGADLLERAVAEATRAFGKLDVIFANAGFGVVAPLKKLALDDYRRQFETNVFGVLRTIYAALPELEKSRGNLAIVGSVASWVATPGASPYSMSKYALRALANSITPELRASGITVTLLSPGFVASEIRITDNQGKVHPGSKDPIPPRMVVSRSSPGTAKCSSPSSGSRRGCCAPSTREWRRSARRTTRASGSEWRLVNSDW